MELSIFRTILLVLGSILFLSTWIAMARGRASFGAALRWSVIWASICYLAINPKITNEIAKLVGIDSGRFLVLYCSVIFLGFCVVVIYARTMRLSRQITLLVREVAIKREDEIQRHADEGEGIA